MLRTALAAAAACLLAWPAAAQVPCIYGPPDMLEKLLSRTGEVPLIEMYVGVPEDTAPALLAVDPDGGFTLYVLSPSGSICIVAHGLDARPAEGAGFPKAIIPGSDS